MLLHFGAQEKNIQKSQQLSVFPNNLIWSFKFRHRSLLVPSVLWSLKTHITVHELWLVSSFLTLLLSFWSFLVGTNQVYQTDWALVWLYLEEDRYTSDVHIYTTLNFWARCLFKLVFEKRDGGGGGGVDVKPKNTSNL